MRDEIHLTVGEVATRWKEHRATVLRRVHNGSLPAIILSRGKKRTTVRFRLSTIEKWEREREKAV
jgi:excisionase family DNA binding protein